MRMCAANLLGLLATHSPSLAAFEAAQVCPALQGAGSVSSTDAGALSMSIGRMTMPAAMHDLTDAACI